MPAIKGFTPLVLALATATKPFLGFLQKGTSVIPTIPGFDPLVLPKFIQGISEAFGPKAFEAALPSPVIIGSKMFSLAPNLQTQEGEVICLPKPFPYKDSHRIPWKYDVTLISSRNRKEEACFNIFSGLDRLTRSGQCYTLEELKKIRKEIGKSTV